MIQSVHIAKTIHLEKETFYMKDLAEMQSKTKDFLFLKMANFASKGPM
jgi:hypothetical protein